ncbi:MAG: TonB family protein [Candidatus Hydrogenedentes bacterium]|nr:TonB family protein [Candidatus Hydrogenedentota bacterium]
MKSIDYKVSCALSLLLHVTAFGVLGLRIPTGDESTATVTQSAFSVQLLADVPQGSYAPPVTEQTMPEILDAVVVPVMATASIETVTEEIAATFVSEIAIERTEPIDTPREEKYVARIVAKTPHRDAPPTARVMPATLHTDFLEYGEPATASRNLDQASLSKETKRAGALPLRLVKPVYPMSARRLGHEGTVVLAIRVLDSGRVGDVTIVTSTGHRSLDQAAVRAARRSRYAPAIFGGLSVSSTQRAAFTFRLEDVDLARIFHKR